MAKAEIIGCFGLTEPDYGSNPSGMITMAREQSDGTWILNGAKMWITNGSTAQIAVVWAKTERRRRRQLDPRLRRPDATPGFQGEGSEGQAVAARERHERARLPGRACSRRRAAAEVRWPEESADVSHAGALRHLVGRDRRGDGVLRGSAIVRGPAHDVRSADRRLSRSSRSGWPTCSPRS